MRNRFLLPSYFWWILFYIGNDAAWAFTSSSLQSILQRRHPTTVTSSSRMEQKNAGDGFMDFFKNLWGGSNDNKNNNSETSQEESAGTTLITSIPVQSIKPGGLRLFLMFYLMGMQNTPDQGTWKAHQPTTKSSSSSESSSSEDYVVEMYFRDATAMLSIELLQNEIRILRCGSVPSTPYLMQESIMVQGILEELDRCAFDESVPIGNRLLTPQPSNAIELARGSLSFG